MIVRPTELWPGTITLTEGTCPAPEATWLTFLAVYLLSLRGLYKRQEEA